MDCVIELCSVTSISEGALQVTRKIDAVDSFETLVTTTNLLSQVVQKVTLQPRILTSMMYKIHIVSILFI